MFVITRYYKTFTRLPVHTLLVLTLVSCGSGSDNTANSIATSTRQFQSLQLTLTMPNNARLGEAIPITFTVKNIGAETITVLLADPEAISQAKLGNTEIWNWAFGKPFSPVLPSSKSIAPGETKSYDLSWNQKDNAGNQVSSGKYSIKSWFNTTSVNGVEVSPQTDLAPEPITVTLP